MLMLCVRRPLFNGVSEEGGIMAARLGKKILIVDDDSDTRLFCTKALQSEGYTTITAANGVAALEVIREQQIDLMLTDFQLAPPVLRLMDSRRRLPFLNGIGLMQKALLSHPNLPVVFISAHGKQLLAANGVDPLKQPLLQKPFNADALRHTVKEVLALAASKPVAPTPTVTQRAYPRFQVNHAVTFCGPVIGEGVVKNLSLGGCEIQSSCIIRPDTYLTLLLAFPKELKPLKINVAVVRWARSGGFGVEFRHVEKQISDSLAHYFSTLRP
jgi:two-component system response regulator (stage 0 sporulation protein F)